jgi:hypothetical protein
MTYIELQKINEKLPKTDIKGKDYVEVNHRIMGFRELYPNGAIRTTIIAMQDGIVTIQAEVLDENGKLLATGLAQEKETSSFINKTSYIENCETSAVGRALGMLGIGIQTSVASYEEVQNAILNQSEPKDQHKKAPKDTPIEDDATMAFIMKVEEMAAKVGGTSKKMEEFSKNKYGTNLANLNVAQRMEVISILNQRVENENKGQTA